MDIKNKITLKIKKKFPEFSSINFQDQEIVIKKHIDRHDKMEIYESYFNIFFGKENAPATRFLSAKYSFILSIIALCTNINYQDVDIDDIIASGLWSKIVAQIDNFNIVTKDLYAFTKMVSEERAVVESVGQRIDQAFNKAMEFLNEISLDNLKEQISEFKSGVKQLEDSGIVTPFSTLDIAENKSKKEEKQEGEKQE